MISIEEIGEIVLDGEKVGIVRDLHSSVPTLKQQLSFSVIFSPFETISTSLWASLHHRFPVLSLSVFSHVICQFAFLHIVPVVVNPIPLRLGRPLLLFPGTTMSIISLERLSSSLLLICPYKFSLFCLRNGGIWHPLV